MTRLLARLLAPLAIAAVAVGVYFVVHDNLDSHASKRTVRVHASTTRRHRTRSASGHGPSTYKVKAGDTLSTIAHATGVSLAKLESLNPSLQPPYSLQAGQRLRLRR